MLKAKDKEARRGNLITFAIVLALTLVTMVLENVMSPGSLLFTVIKKGAVYSLVAVSMNLLNGFLPACSRSVRRASCSSARMPTRSS